MIFFQRRTNRKDCRHRYHVFAKNYLRVFIGNLIRMDLNKKNPQVYLTTGIRAIWLLVRLVLIIAPRPLPFLLFSLLLEYWPHPKSSLAIVVRGCSASLFKGIYITRKNMLGLQSSLKSSTELWLELQRCFPTLLSVTVVTHRDHKQVGKQRAYCSLLLQSVMRESQGKNSEQKPGANN